MTAAASAVSASQPGLERANLDSPGSGNGSSARARPSRAEPEPGLRPRDDERRGARPGYRGQPYTDDRGWLLDRAACLDPTRPAGCRSRGPAERGGRQGPAAGREAGGRRHGCPRPARTGVAGRGRAGDRGQLLPRARPGGAEQVATRRAPRPAGPTAGRGHGAVRRSDSRGAGRPSRRRRPG